jgi:DNA helicase-4
MKNPKQLKKRLVSDKNKTNPLEILLYKKNVCEAVILAIEKIVTAYGEKSNVLILGRNNYDIEALQNNNDFIIHTEKDKIKILCKKYSSLEIEFLTVHKSKGLEADNVIVINMENKLSGFPNKIADDPILSLVLSNSAR